MNWIKCSDKIPREGQAVLFLGHYTFPHHSDEPYILYGFCNKGGEEIIWKDNDGFRYKNITHWMPLPEKPNEMD